jgi:HTH-type transcriptional regulator / antitoxin HipB
MCKNMHKITPRSLDPAEELAKVRVSALLDRTALQVMERRRALGLTQKEVADLAGVSRRSIIAIEDGSPTSLNTFLRILDVVGLQMTLQPGRSDELARDA